MIGEKFGKLTVLYRDLSKKRTYYFCSCNCNNEIIKNSIEAYSIKNGKSTSCGCYRKQKMQIVGHEAKNRLLIHNLNRKKEIFKKYFNCEIISTYSYKKRTFIEAKCFCGNIFSCRLSSLKSGNTKSCGCLQEKFYAKILNDLQNQGYFEGYIYKITNKINGNFYIGKSLNFQKRWEIHIFQLKNNCHHSKKFQEDFNRNPNVKNYSFDVIHIEKFYSSKNYNKNLSSKENEFLFKLKPILNTLVIKE